MLSVFRIYIVRAAVVVLFEISHKWSIYLGVVLIRCHRIFVHFSIRCTRWMKINFNVSNDERKYGAEGDRVRTVESWAFKNYDNSMCFVLLHLNIFVCLLCAQLAASLHWKCNHTPCGSLSLAHVRCIDAIDEILFHRIQVKWNKKKTPREMEEKWMCVRHVCKITLKKITETSYRLKRASIIFSTKILRNRFDCRYRNCSLCLFFCVFFYRCEP